MPDEPQEFGEGIPLDAPDTGPAGSPPSETPDLGSLLASELGKHGIDTSGMEPGSLFPAFAEGLQKLRELPHLEARARQAEELEWQLHHLRQQAQQPPIQQTPAALPEAERPKWSKPEVSAEAKRLYEKGVFEVDERTGLLAAPSPALQHYADEYNKLLQFNRQFAERFVESPVDVLFEAGLKDKWDELRREAAIDAIEFLRQEQAQQAQFHQQRQQGAVLDQFVSANSQNFFVHDKKGNLVDQYGRPTDQQGNVLGQFGQPTGEQAVPVLLPAGRLFQQYVAEARGLNPQIDPVRLVQHAWGRLVQHGASLAKTQKEQQDEELGESPLEAKARRRERFSDGITHTPSKAGTVRDSEQNGTQQSKGRTFKQIAMQEARKAGLALHD